MTEKLFAVCVVCVLAAAPDTQEEEQFICELIAQLGDGTHQTQLFLQSGVVSQSNADAFRARHRALTNSVLEFLTSRQRFERSAAFSRASVLKKLRGLSESTEELLEHHLRANRYYSSAEALFGPTKEEAPEPSCCAAQALRTAPSGRPTEICFTARAVKRPRLTPHPRAGPDAVAAAGGAVEALLAEEESSQSEEEGVFSSTDEEGQTNDSDAD